MLVSILVFRYLYLPPSMVDNAPINGGVPSMKPISDGDNPSDFMCKEIKFSAAKPETRM